MKLTWHPDGDVLLLECGGKTGHIWPRNFSGRNAAMILNQTAMQYLKRAHVEIEAVTFS